MIWYSITAEEFGHVELVSNTINVVNQGTSFTADPNLTPLQYAKTKGIRMPSSPLLKLQCQVILWAIHGAEIMFF